MTTETCETCGKPCESYRDQYDALFDSASAAGIPVECDDCYRDRLAATQAVDAPA